MSLPRTKTPCKETKHTPGPWTVFARPGTETLEVQAAGKPVAHWMGFDGADQPWDEKAANARLMAAAPDLLAAAAKVLLDNSGIAGVSSAEYRAIAVSDLKPLAVAVAKARGEEVQS